MPSPKIKRTPRKKDTRQGYKPAGEPEGYTPARKTRKAPHAYWRCNPHPDGFGGRSSVNGLPQALPAKKVEPDWDDPDFWSL